MAEFIMESLKKEHPEIYQKYVPMFYKSWRATYNDNKIIIKRIEVTNHGDDSVIQIILSIPNNTFIMPSVQKS